MVEFPKFDKRVLIKYFLLSFLPLLALLIGLSTVVFFQENRQLLSRTEENELHTITHLSQEPGREIGEVRDELLLLANQPYLHRFLDTPNSENREAVLGIFLNFARHRTIYDRICFLDSSGMEALRVDYNEGLSVTVPPDELTRETDRYYFQEAIKMISGEIYFSPLELNSDEDGISTPLKPAIRFATPVVDQSGNTRGILVLNYLANRLLQNLDSNAYHAIGKILLVNANGYWLKGVSSTDEWGFMYDDRKDRTLAATFPRAATQISTNEAGQIYTPEGLFTFKSLAPFESIQLLSITNTHAPPSPSRPEEIWRLISYVSPQAIMSSRRLLQKKFLLLDALLLVILLGGATALALAMASRKQTQQELEQSHEDLQKRVRERTAELELSYLELQEQFEKQQQTDEEITRNYQTQSVLNKLLHLSLEDRPIGELLELFISHITSLPWLDIESKGAIFLLNQESKTLELKADRNLAEPLKKICGTVPLGRCLCGRAALTQKIVFADCIDERHDHTYEGILPHGHFCVPIVSSDSRTLGVFTVYLKANQPRDQQTEDILLAAASAMAGIIERCKAVELQRENEEKYRGITEAANDAIIMINEQGNIIFWNPAAEKTFGYSAPEVMGKDMHALLAPPRYKEKYQKPYAHFIATGEGGTIGRTIEVHGLRKDGSEFPMELSLARINIKGHWGAVGTVRDITERSDADTERKRLESLYLQAQKMEAVGQLAGGVAHDFNNLLTGIIGFLGLALEQMPKGSETYADVNESLSLAKKAADLTRQLLAFSRKQHIEPREINLNNLVTNLTKMLKRIIGEDIELNTKLAPEIGTICVDPGQLEQVIANLTVNSSHAMPDGGTLIIETQNVFLDENAGFSHNIDIPAGSYVMLSVSDTGCGMDMETQRQVFEPFFTTRATGEGTGLGLSTVYGIIKQHNGYILLYSEPGEGTTFKIYLPRVDKTHAAELLPPTPPTISGSETILFVEDEEVVRQVIKRMLTNMGYTVIPANGPEEAQAIFDKQKSAIDLLITDIIMPKMDGKTLYDLLHQKQPDLKVLFVSGYTDQHLTQKGISEFGISFLSKPFTRSEIGKRIRKILAEPATL